MRYLLDTNVWLWSITTPEKIGRELLDLMSDQANDLFLSAASTWEISIKYQIGKLPLPEPPESFVLSRLVRDGIEALPIYHHHTVRVASLPAHHRDPFDRLLIATAQTESLTILTSDRQLQAYDVDLLLA